MHVAVANGIDGIIGECGGSMACGTCHCYVDEAWAAAVGSPGESELAMLDCGTSEAKATSRLSCQIMARHDLDGLVVRVPNAQR
jgi:2Fe-2S ferredoxin